MTKRWLRFGVITLSCLLTIATSAFAESSWVIWQQDFIFTERWWIPKGWLFRKTTTPSTPIARWESPTLDKCQTMRFQVALQDLKLLGVVEQQGGKHRRVADRLEPLRMCALRPTTGGHRTGRGMEVNSNLPLSLICAGFALLALATSASADCARSATCSA